MRLHILLATSVLVISLVISSHTASAQQAPVSTRLDPVGGSGVSGTASLSPQAGGAQASLEVNGLQPGAIATAAINAGTCAQPSASAAGPFPLIADASGSARISGTVNFRGAEAVALATLLDGNHVVTVSSGGRIVACGVIPAAQGAVAPPPAAAPPASVQPTAAATPARTSPVQAGPAPAPAQAQPSGPVRLPSTGNSGTASPAPDRTTGVAVLAATGLIGAAAITGCLRRRSHGR